MNNHIDPQPQGQAPVTGYTKQPPLPIDWSRIRPTVPPDAERCGECGCGLDDHHKLRCEAEHCSGCNGWLCPRHKLRICGCTYAGGAEPEGGQDG